MLLHEDYYRKLKNNSLTLLVFIVLVEDMSYKEMVPNFSFFVFIKFKVSHLISIYDLISIIKGK